MMKKSPMIVAVFSLFAVFLTAVLAVPVAHSGSQEFEILTLSTPPEMVSGGDVLVQINVPHNVSLTAVHVKLNGQDITGDFRPGHEPGTLLGLVEGLVLGKNKLVASAGGHGRGQDSESLELVNYPITGPIFSGPHETPFICMTQSFVLPVTGGNLGPPLDENCSIATRVDYVYRSTGGTFKPLPNPTVYPADLAETTTNQGHTVKYIVRVETGTINRAIYQTAILHNPVLEATPDPWTRPAGWNGRLIYTHGGGCRSGWYVQGNSTGGVLDAVMLSQGYATASASLNVFGNNCNDLLTSETTMMVKERLIESYGAPLFTIGWGSSGGSYQSHQASDNYPGLFDGIIVGHSFPDVTSATIFTLADARLLLHYFTDIAPGLFTDEQQRAVSGFGQLGSIPNLSDGAKRIDPVAEFYADVPANLRYNASTNPGGARATVYDHTVNVYGRDEHGFARRPLDNVGVQYGLAVLNSGAISKEQFLDLNERIGGLDIDANHVPWRHAADLGATRRAYQSGRILNGGGGLAATPIIDQRDYRDAIPTGDIHMKIHQFSTRARLIKANGHADNHVMLVQDVSFSFNTANPVLQEAIRQMDQWLTNLMADTSHHPKAIKVVRAKPADLVDACWTTAHLKIVEPQFYGGVGTSTCNTLYPSFPTPRHVAGTPLANDIVKCQLKRIDYSDYAVSFTKEEKARLRKIFPQGVCDWSEPGVEQRPLRTWASFGPSPENLIFDVTRPHHGHGFGHDHDWND